MIIHHLKASGFRMMGEPVNIEFPNEGRIGILGQNESGKTTLFQAVECALYGLKKGSGPEADRENLVTWGKNEAKLEIEFTSGQNRYNLQRVFNSKNIHRANLTPVISGVKDRSSSITGLKDVEDKIEQITGMDRDSFTKLVYIKQKDLDALKELAKAKREQLVNKVMGIEIFDDASEKVKKDISLIADELRSMELQLEMVRKNKEDYESKLTQKSTLETQVAQQQPNLDAKTAELENTKALLAKYDWISNYNSATELECSLKGQAAQAEKEIQDILQLEEQAKKLGKTQENYKPEVTELKTLVQRLSDIERRYTEVEAALNTLQEKKQETISRLSLSEKEIKNLSQNLPAQKHRLLVQFGATMITGLACLAIAFLTTIFLIGGAAILLALCAYFFIQYLKLDKLATQNNEIQVVDKQIEDQESKVSAIQNEKTNTISSSPYKTSEDAQNRLNTISTLMKTEAGEGSIEGIEALIRNTNQTLQTSQQANPQARKISLDTQIQAKQIEIQQLQKTKPALVDEIQYTKEQHELLKKQRETIQTEWNTIKQSIDNDTGTIKQLKIDLERLAPDFELYPQLQKDVETCKEKIQLLDQVNLQLSETSKELRNKVLPYARLIINQILPTLTSDRYSDFEITEDLKFKVHSNEAGGYKEREIFSGGTQDQFLIALRLAFTQSILDSRVMADKYSLLMDECTSSSDEIRKQGIFEVLDAMKKTFSQIFIIAHEDIATYVDNHMVLERNDHGYTEIKSRSWMK
jgi:exonuclease SbcC